MSDELRPIGDAFDLRRAFGHGFAAVRYAAGPMWLAGVLMSISDGCGGIGDVPDWPGEDGDSDASAWRALPLDVAAWTARAGAHTAPTFDRGELVAWLIGALIAIVLVATFVALLLFALHCWVQTGFVRLHASILEHASDELAPLFSGRDRFWDMAGYKLLAFLILTATTCVAAWPGALLMYAGYAQDSRTLVLAGVGAALILGLPALIYVGLGVFLGELCVVFESRGPVHAVRRSWALAHGNRTTLFAFAFVALLIQAASWVAGLLLCCIGLFATVPLGRALTGFAKTESFLLFTRGPEQAAHFRLWQRQAAEDHASIEDAAGPVAESEP